MWYSGTSDSGIKQVIIVTWNTFVLKNPQISEINDKIVIFLKGGKF